MIRGVESNRLANLLMTFFRPTLLGDQGIKVFGKSINLPKRKQKEVD